MSEVWIAVIAALGASGVAGALVSWWKDRDKDDVEVTQMLRQMSKEAVSDARTELAGLRADMREVKQILQDLARIVERDVIPLIPDHPQTQENLRILTMHAREIA